MRENNRQEAPTREQLQKLDCLKDFETMCKILNIPMEVNRIWARKRLMPWFRADMTAWLYEYARKHMSKHGRVYSGYQLDIGAGAFKRAFVTHRNAVTTAVKREEDLSNLLKRKIVALFFPTTEFLSFNIQDKKQARFPKGRSIEG